MDFLLTMLICGWVAGGALHFLWIAIDDRLPSWKYESLRLLAFLLFCGPLACLFWIVGAILIAIFTPIGKVSYWIRNGFWP